MSSDPVWTPENPDVIGPCDIVTLSMSITVDINVSVFHTSTIFHNPEADSIYVEDRAEGQTVDGTGPSHLDVGLTCGDPVVGVTDGLATAGFTCIVARDILAAIIFQIGCVVVPVGE